MKRISIGSWAYTIGPYEDKPVDFDTVCTRLKDLGFDGVELGGFPPHPNPDDMPEASQRQEVVAKMNDWGLSFSGLAANLWGEQLVNTTDQTKYIEEFTKNCAFCRDLGIKGIRVDNSRDLIPDLEEAFATDGPVLLSLPIDYRENALLTKRLGDISVSI